MDTKKETQNKTKSILFHIVRKINTNEHEFLLYWKIIINTRSLINI